MSRKDAVFHEGGYYHVYNRGCNRNLIFREPENYRYLLRLLDEATTKTHVAVVAYCLMPNHFHFLLRQCSDMTISSTMQEVFNRYVKAYNKRYRRSGTLFEGPFRAKPVNDDQALLTVCRYIHRNPVEGGLVMSPDRWLFSDYLDWIGVRSLKPSRGFMSSSYHSTPADYKQWVLRDEGWLRR